MVSPTSYQRGGEAGVARLAAQVVLEVRRRQHAAEQRAVRGCGCGDVDGGSDVVGETPAQARITHVSSAAAGHQSRTNARWRRHGARTFQAMVGLPAPDPGERRQGLLGQPDGGDPRAERHGVRGHADHACRRRRDRRRRTLGSRYRHDTPPTGSHGNADGDREIVRRHDLSRDGRRPPGVEWSCLGTAPRPGGLRVPR